MNERIQELLIEAHKQTNGGIYNGHLSVWTEKFAELIVQDLIHSMIKRYGDDDELPIQEIKLFVKEHFGVE
jgi:hypothetical protein